MPADAACATLKTLHVGPCFPMLTRHGITWLQVLLLCVFWLITESFTITHHWPVPGSVIGLGVLLLLLQTKVVATKWVASGANFLLGHLMLFFVPAMLGLLSHPELRSLLGLKLLAAVLIGTVVVMSGTALIVEFAFRRLAEKEITERHEP